MAQPTPLGESAPDDAPAEPSSLESLVSALTPVVDFEIRAIRGQLTRVVDPDTLRIACRSALREAVEEAETSELAALTSVAVHAIRIAIIDYITACARGEHPLGRASEPPAAAHTPAEHLPAAVHAYERTEALRAALDDLPEHMRVVVQQSFLHDRPLADIADELGQPEHLVVGVRAEALNLLRTRVAHHLAERDHGLSPRGPRRESWERAQALT